MGRGGQMAHAGEHCMHGDPGAMGHGNHGAMGHGGQGHRGHAMRHGEHVMNHADDEDAGAQGC
jgi:hypothetical protein